MLTFPRIDPNSRLALRATGTNPATGLDCSGYTQLVYRQLGIEPTGADSVILHDDAPRASLRRGILRE